MTGDVDPSSSNMNGYGEGDKLLTHLAKKYCNNRNVDLLGLTAYHEGDLKYNNIDKYHSDFVF